MRLLGLAIMGMLWLVAGCGSESPEPSKTLQAPLGDQPESIADIEKPHLLDEVSSQASDGVDAQKYFLEFQLDPEARKVGARQILRLTQLNAHEFLKLDAADGLLVSDLALNGQAALHTHQGGVLIVEVPPELQREPHLELEIRYMILDPQAGFRFPRSANGEVLQAWTHSEPLEARHWFVSVDRPADKALFETRVRVPSGWKVLSNGSLVSDDEDLNRNIYHWVMNAPMPTYLFSLVAGPMVVLEDSWQGIPLSYWTPEHLKKETLHTLGRTPEMMRMLSTQLIPYPFEKYAVGIAMDYGGAMEHTTATSFSHTLLTDDGKVPSRGEVVALHELAHHWFGDAVTCETWDHLWLNESFATYFENLYIRELRGEEAFLEANLRKRNSYFTREAGKAKDGNNGGLGPVVNFKNSPTQKFNAVTYEKGSQVLHMLREMMGEAKFFQGLRSYLMENFMGTARTEGLQRALERAYGQSLEGFFQQWIYRAGYPELAVEISAVRDGKIAVTVEQNQKSEVGLFQFPLSLQIFDGEKAIKTKTLMIAKKSHRFEFAVMGEAAAVVVDTGKTLLSKQKVTMPGAAWKLLWQHRLGTHLHQVEALTEISEQLTFEEVNNVVEDGSRFESLRAHALKTLGQTFFEDSRLFGLATRFIGVLEPAALRIQAAGLLKKTPLTPEQEQELYPQWADLVARDKSWEVAAAAADTLVARKAPNAFDAMKAAFTPEISKRGYLFSSLVPLFGRLGDPRGIDLLGEAILHPFASVEARYQLASGLGGFRNDAAVEKLRLALEAELTRPDFSQWGYAVSMTIIDALKGMDLDSARAVLTAVASDSKWPLAIRERAK